MSSKHKGISGWFGVYTPQETSSSQQQPIMVGGLEIAVKFSHHSDMERVIKAAQGVGWQVPQNEEQDHEDAWRESIGKMPLTFSVPIAWLPVHCLLQPGHTELQRSTYCYFRYKFYDQEVFCSQMKHPSLEESGEEGRATVTFQGSRTVNLKSTPPLIWYLREEKLEVQVWVAFKKDKGQRPRETDHLVGSAFVDLSAFAKTPKQKLTLSGKKCFVFFPIEAVFIKAYNHIFVGFYRSVSIVQTLSSKSTRGSSPFACHPDG